MFKNRFPFYHQHDRMDCGPACLQMVAKFYGKFYELETLRDLCYLNKDGVNLINLSEAAEQLGFRTLSVQITLEKIVQSTPLPCILLW